MQEVLDDFFVFGLQLRNGFGQRRRHLMQRQNGLFAGQNHVGALAQPFPVTLHGAQLVAYQIRSRRQAGGRVAFSQVAPAHVEIIARIGQQLERLGFAGSRFGGVFRDALRQDAQLTGMPDVLFVVVGLSVEVGEVGEQQHDENDKRHEQQNNLRPASCAFP